jgi:Protein of unknown function (DUF2569)
VVCPHCGGAVDPHDALHAEPTQAGAPPTATLTAAEPLPSQPAPYTPAYLMDNGLTGIGGWLILVAIGLGIGPFFRIHGIAIDSQFLFGRRYLTALSTRPGLEAILFYELVTNSFFLAYLLMLNVVFYQKRRRFPTLMIFNLAAQFVTQLIDHLWAMRFGHSAQTFSVVQSFVAALLWIPYMLNSIRVEQTFVN